MEIYDEAFQVSGIKPCEGFLLYPHLFEAVAEIDEEMKRRQNKLGGVQRRESPAG